MGTNYYARYNICKCCGRYDQEHIGKSSMGWTFTFHATELCKSWKDWQFFLKAVKIFDEYGREISYEDFIILVEDKKSSKHNHALDFGERYGDYTDDEGNSMSPGEFS